jgi:transcriptional regulator with XRE-family HTH domain
MIAVLQIVMQGQMNLALKTAFWKLRKSQVRVMHETGISESRLSRIVHGHLKATKAEKQALAKALKTPVTELFPNDDSQAVA